MINYLTLVHADKDGYGFTAPDVPGFTAYAAGPLDVAVKVAKAVLAHHLAAIVDVGGTIPKPRAPEAIKADSDFAGDYEEADYIVMLPALLPFGRSKRVNLSLDENTIELIDEAAQARGITRSAFVAQAARALIAAEG